MKFGMCLPASDYARINRVGADYIELGAGSIYRMSDDSFEKLCDDLQGKNLCYSCNGLVVPEVRLTGSEVNFDSIRSYCEKTFGRLNRLGVKMLVFGSGNAKNVPEGFPMEKAWEQLFEVGNIFSDYAEKFSQTIAVEALRYSEVNIVNTIEDAAFYAHKVNRSNFKILIDFYHMYQNSENLDVIEKYADEIVHIHMAGPTRGTPDMSEKEFVEERMSLLKKIGYNGGVSFECAMPEDDESVSALLKWYRELTE